MKFETRTWKCKHGGYWINGIKGWLYVMPVVPPFWNRPCKCKPPIAPHATDSQR